MTITNRYIAVLAAVLLGTAVVFAWAGETRLDLFVSVYVIETLVVNQLFVWLSERTRGALRAVERLLVACFAVIVVLEIVRILSR